MGKRGRRRNREGEADAAEPKKRTTKNGEPELPSTFARTVERWARLMPVLQSGADLSQEIEERELKLTEHMARFDAIHVLGQIVLSEAPWRPDEYVESEHSGAAHVIETVTATLLRRPGRAGGEDFTPAIDANLLGPVRELAHEVALLEAVRRISQIDAKTPAEGRARLNAAIGHLLLRGPGWTWQEHDLLCSLFGDDATLRLLEQGLGFSPNDAVALADATAALLPLQLDEDRERSMTQTEEALAWAERALGGWQENDAPFRDRALTAIWALNRIGDAMVITPEALATTAGRSEQVTGSYLRALSVTFGQTGRLFDIADALRVRPFVDLGDDRFFLAEPGADTWALRTLFDGALKGNEPYYRRRGRWLEGRATDLLTNALAPDEVHMGVRIVPAQGGDDLGEIDALLRIGDVVLAVEAKGATLRPGARRGGQALTDHLRETLTKAAQQGSRAATALRGEESVRLVSADGQPLELGERVREIHTIVVTLDDLSAVAPTIWELVGTDLMPTDLRVPWLVTLHELDIVMQTVERASEFIHFLRRRARLNQLGGKIASDELDWWMLYLRSGLWFEGDESAEGPTRFLSQTDALDAWVLYQRGIRKKPAPKPQLELDEATLGMLDRLESERPRGWVAAACTLLDPSGDTQEQIQREIAAGRERARERGRAQRMTFGFDSAPDPLLISAVVVPDERASELLSQLRRYVAERVDESGIQRVLGIGVRASSDRPYDALVLLEDADWKVGGEQASAS